MRKVRQCTQCGARDAVKHHAKCRGRKVKIVVYDKTHLADAANKNFPNKPANIRCYDSIEQIGDRYTLVRLTPIGFVRLEPPFPVYTYFGCNAAPFHPQGIGQHGEAPGQRPLQLDADRFPPIRWNKLPMDVRIAAWQLAIDEDKS